MELKKLIMIAILLLGGVSSAYACAVCFSMEGPKLEAYYFGTFLLTTLPLFMIGSIIFFVYRSVKKYNQKQLKLRTSTKQNSFPPTV